LEGEVFIDLGFLEWWVYEVCGFGGLERIMGLGMGKVYGVVCLWGLWVFWKLGCIALSD
jgi:hypothetical protein